jgi:hypothetical protein
LLDELRSRWLEPTPWGKLWADSSTALGQIVPGFGFWISVVRLGGGFDPAAMGLGCALPRFDSAVWASDGSLGAFSRDAGMTLRCGRGRGLKGVSS